MTGGWKCRLLGHQFGPLRPHLLGCDIVPCCRCDTVELVLPGGHVLWAATWATAWDVANTWTPQRPAPDGPSARGLSSDGKWFWGTRVADLVALAQEDADRGPAA